MHTELSPQYKDTPDGQAAQALLSKCVHCGFCTATCPTYQLLGDELDGPRGRIYLIKQVLEGHAASRATQLHLDRCLTCRNCESTCPSGVQYAQLLDIGRKLVDAQVPRPVTERVVRWALKEGLPSAAFAPALALGRALRPLLPRSVQAKVPPLPPGSANDAPRETWPTRLHAKRVLLHAGCVQPAMSPHINAATARVLDAAGFQTLLAPRAGCCGALKFHLNDQTGALAEMRANIDAWWPLLQGSSPVQAIVSNASGCGLSLKEYGHYLKDDPAYAARAHDVSQRVRDVSELLPELVPALQGKLRIAPRRVAFHPPCSLQHGQQLKGQVEQHLRTLGFDLAPPAVDAHLCCGSAGTYSVLQPGIAGPLRDRKLAALDTAFEPHLPEVIASANMGCITHLQAGTRAPVMHWIELVDQALVAQP